MNRKIALILAALLAAMPIASCGGSSSGTDTTAASVDQQPADATEALTGRDAVMSDLPADLDFGGKTVTLLCREEENFAREFLAEEENGDTKKDDKDFFGFYLPRDASLAMAAAGGWQNVKPDGEGGYEWDFLDERNIRLFETLFDLIKQESVLFTNEEHRTELFHDGYTIFYAHRLEKTEELREMVDDYGLVPIPKLDQAQESYYSLDGDAASQISVPVTVKDPELVSAFLEKMGELSYKMVTPKYLDTALKGKYLRDDDSARMVDLIISGTWQDFAEINASMVTRMIGHSFLAQLTTDTLASTYESKKATLESNLKTLLDNYKNT